MERASKAGGRDGKQERGRSPGRAWMRLPGRVVTALVSALALGLAGASGCGGSVDSEGPSETASRSEALGEAQQAALSTPIQCITLGSGAHDHDTMISLEKPDQSYGASAFAFASGGTAQSPAAPQQALFAFDLGAVPAGATLVSAGLALSQTSTAPTTLDLHTILAAWDEGTVTWSSFGGAYDPAVIASFSSAGASVNVDVLGLVQGWIGGALPNHGVLVAGTGAALTRFKTREYGVAAQRPALHLCYKVVCAPGTLDCDGDAANGCEAVAGAPEICDGKDNDCDGQIDEDLPPITCGVGACAVTLPACVNGVPTVCNPHASDGKACDDGHDCTQADVCSNGVCAGVSKPAGTLCRAAAGACDLAETCNGASPDCPSDKVAGQGAICRVALGPCDSFETCDGKSNTCPPDGFAPPGTLCRPAVPGGCDLAETCTGTLPTCPSDKVAGQGAICRVALGPCDSAETCDGKSNTCPLDGFAPPGTLCRPAVPGGCDLAETCTGTSNACPPDHVAGAGAICRVALGACDVAETCNGSSSACPADVRRPAGTVCRASTGNCDVAEICDGASGFCPADAQAASGTPCADGNLCTSSDTCNGNGTCVGGGAPDALPSVVPLTGITGSTVGAPREATRACGVVFEHHSEVRYSYTAPVTGHYTIDTLGSHFDTVLFLLDGSSCGAQLACNDDANVYEAITASRISNVALTAGQTIVIVIDAYYADSEGSYVLNIQLS